MLAPILVKTSKAFTSKPLLTIVLFHAFTRLCMLMIYSNVSIFNDSGDYIQLAERLLQLNLSGHDGIRSPGYPLLLAAAGNILPLAVAFQIIIGAFTSWYTYKILLLLRFTKDASIWVALILNSFLNVIFYEFSILMETLVLFLTLLCSYHILRLFFYGANSLKHTVWLGFLLGILVLTKPFYIFIPFILYGIYTARNFTIKRIVNRQLILFIFPLIAFLGWSYVNKVYTGYFTSTTLTGIYISQNCVNFAEKTTPEYQEIGNIYAKYRDENIKAGNSIPMSIWQAREELATVTGLSDPDLFHELEKYSKATISKNPGGYAKQVFISWRNFWRTSIYWNDYDFNSGSLYTIMNSFWLLQNKGLLLLKIIFLLLIPYHVFLYFKNRQFTPELIFCIIISCASVLQAMATYGTNSRFSYPFEFLMIIIVLTTFRNRLKLLFVP